jgi:hypothetical protein
MKTLDPHMEALKPVEAARDRAIDIPLNGPEKIAAYEEWRREWNKYRKAALAKGWHLA